MTTFLPKYDPDPEMDKGIYMVPVKEKIGSRALFVMPSKYRQLVTSYG